MGIWALASSSISKFWLIINYPGLYSVGLFTDVHHLQYCLMSFPSRFYTHIDRFSRKCSTFAQQLETWSYNNVQYYVYIQGLLIPLQIARLILITLFHRDLHLQDDLELSAVWDEIDLLGQYTYNG